MPIFYLRIGHFTFLVQRHFMMVVQILVHDVSYSRTNFHISPQGLIIFHNISPIIHSVTYRPDHQEYIQLSYFNLCHRGTDAQIGAFLIKV